MGGDLVTGEAVVLELRLAKLPSRAVAETLDLLVQFGGLLVISLIGAFTGLSDSLDGAAAVALGLTLYVGIFVGYPVLFESLSRGRSLGKMAMGLRVVREDGGPIQFRHALVRGLLAIFEVYPFGVIAVITSLLSAKGKRVGDYLAGTVVVRERVPNIAAPSSRKSALVRSIRQSPMSTAKSPSAGFFIRPPYPHFTALHLLRLVQLQPEARVFTINRQTSLVGTTARTSSRQTSQVFRCQAAVVLRWAHAVFSS